MTSKNLHERSKMDTGQHIRKKPKILDSSVLEEAVEASKCQECEIGTHTHTHTDAGHVEHTDWLDCLEHNRQELRCLSSTDSHTLLCLPARASDQFKHWRCWFHFVLHNWQCLPHSQELATCPYPEPDQSSPCPPPPTSWRSILILSSHLRLGVS